jgi:tetratricopeptide (TPR) repeat protein
MTRSLKLLPAIVALLALVMCAPLARADDASELERAKASYDAGRYGEGVERFRQLLSQDSSNALRDPVAIERARAYYAACLIALDRNNEADAQIEAIIRADPLYTPDPVVFPGKVVNRVLDIKTRLKVEIERAVQQRADVERAKKQKQEQEQQAYIDALQQQAGQESVVVRHSRWIAALPFGVGQFQNGQEALGYAFLASETLLAGTSIVSGVIHMQLIAQLPDHPPGSINFQDYDSRRQAARDINLYSTLGLVAVGLGGIIQAQLAFVPELHETRARPLPKAPAVTPLAFASSSGWAVGVTGKF